MKNNDGNSLIFYKVFIYILGIFQAMFYTPVVLSFALFIILIPMLFQQELYNPLFRFLPGGQYDTTTILAVYGKYAFGLSLIISLIEILFKKQLMISAKSKIIWLSLTLLIGYAFVFIFLITKTQIDITTSLIVLIPFLLLALSATALTGLLAVFTKFLERTFVNQE